MLYNSLEFYHFIVGQSARIFAAGARQKESTWKIKGYLFSVRRIAGG